MEPVIVIGAGQPGVAAAAALLREGLRPVVLEADPHPTGSWPRYYDSLVLFTPAHFNALPGLPFPGEPHRYPTRDEAADYLRTSAARLDCEFRTGHRVTSVNQEGGEYRVLTEGGSELTAPMVVAATGSFARPHCPDLPGLAAYTGRVLHAAEYRSPAPFAGRRVVVVGAGNSAVQIAVELARPGVPAHDALGHHARRRPGRPARRAEAGEHPTEPPHDVPALGLRTSAGTRRRCAPPTARTWCPACR
ncbi:NAD(P)/FAD-dependent oxidoreductase [Pseudonocardia aurantiaca]|uniref:Flavin-containing monooxygenase n=1 Tax=Pseudonocardia aurantiaca TaxID=75290 RepID=A0ABW4FJD5_9PSEU